jgi:hypothetical protein
MLQRHQSVYRNVRSWENGLVSCISPQVLEQRPNHIPDICSGLSVFESFEHRLSTVSETQFGLSA